MWRWSGPGPPGRLLAPIACSYAVSLSRGHAQSLVQELHRASVTPGGLAGQECRESVKVKAVTVPMPSPVSEDAEQGFWTDPTYQSGR